MNRPPGDHLPPQTVASFTTARCRLSPIAIPNALVTTEFSELLADPQVRHLRVAAPVTHPIAGEIEILRNATHLDGVPDDIRLPAPEPGEHTDEILAELGLFDEQNHKAIPV